MAEGTVLVVKTVASTVSVGVLAYVVELYLSHNGERGVLVLGSVHTQTWLVRCLGW